MLLAENGLPLLLEQLGQMPAADRRAILARLSPQDRKRLDCHRRGALALAPAEDGAKEAHSPEVAERLAAIRSGAESGVTPAVRETLRRALGFDAAPQPARPQAGTASLMDSLGGMLRRSRSAA